MRVKVVASLLAAACLLGVGYYFWRDASVRAGQAETQQANSGGQADSGKRGETGRAETGRGGPQPVSVVAATATTADFPVRRYAIGFISSPAVVDVTARISSQVTAIAVKDGQMVKAGDLLFSLDDRALQAGVAKDKATLARDQALLASAEADLARAKDLAAKQAGTEQAYDQAVAAEKAAEATVDSDQATLDADTVQLGFAKIAAPISGRLGAVNVTAGDIVGPSNGGAAQTPLVTITQMDPLQVSFNLPEGDLGLLHKALAEPVQGAVTLNHDGDPQPIGKGTLDFVDSSVDTASGTIAARASIPNLDLSLWPGQYVDVVLNAGTMPNMVSVPTVAVQPSQKGSFVYVIKPDNTVEARQVQVVLTQGENSAISNGLQAGEKVVTEGQLRLKAGSAVHVADSSSDTGATKAAEQDEDEAMVRP